MRAAHMEEIIGCKGSCCLEMYKAGPSLENEMKQTNLPVTWSKPRDVDVDCQDQDGKSIAISRDVLT
jgi:hypothetical protein